MERGLAVDSVSSERTAEPVRGTDPVTVRSGDEGAARTSDADTSSLTSAATEPDPHWLGPVEPVGLGVLHGLQKVPLVTLTEALHALDELELDAACVCAKAFANNLLLHGPDPNGLTVDEIASIHLYTQETPLYMSLNAALRSEDRSSSKPFFPYIKLFQTALGKVPTASAGGAIWRGIRASLLPKDFPEGHLLTWWGYSSCTLKIGVTDGFANEKNVVLFCINMPNSARDITRYSAVKKEKEVLLPAGTMLRVEGAARPGGGSVVVHLTDLMTPVVPIQSPLTAPAVTVPAPAPLSPAPTPVAAPAPAPVLATSGRGAESTPSPAPAPPPASGLPPSPASAGPAPGAPLILPPGWEMGRTPEGKVYYMSHYERKTQWEPPPGAVPAPVAPPAPAPAPVPAPAVPSPAPVAAPPPVLPPGWAANTAPDGRIYYVNHIEKRTQWEFPTAPPPAAYWTPPPVQPPVPALAPSADERARAINMAAYERFARATSTSNLPELLRFCEEVYSPAYTSHMTRTDDNNSVLLRNKREMIDAYVKLFQTYGPIYQDFIVTRVTAETIDFSFVLSYPSGNRYPMRLTWLFERPGILRSTTGYWRQA